MLVRSSPYHPGSFALATECYGVLVQLEELVARLGVPLELRATISSKAFVDNSAALQLAQNQRLTSRTRYYHCQSHHFWQAVNSDPPQIIPTQRDTTLMNADYFTKSMPQPGFLSNRKRVQGE